MASKTTTGVILNAVTPPSGEVVEYAKSSNSTGPVDGWQTGLVFENLSPATAYYFFARVTANEQHEAGGVSSGTRITTNRSDYTIPADAPSSTPAQRTATSITLLPVAPPAVGELIQYAYSTTSSSDGCMWQTELTFSDLTADTDYYFFARVAESSTHSAGPASDGTQIRTDLSDRQKVDAAKTAVDAALADFTATNATDAAPLFALVNAALTEAGRTDVTPSWDENGAFGRVDATEDEPGQGRITGTIDLSCTTVSGTATDTVWVDRPVERTDLQKLQCVKPKVDAALAGMKVTNETTATTLDTTVDRTIPRLIADKTALKAAIASANETRVKFPVNNNLPADVPNGIQFVGKTDVQILENAIVTAQAVANSATATTPEVSAATTALENAVLAFERAVKTGTFTESASSPSSTIKPVANIAGMTTTVTAGTALTLTGMVSPADATSRTIAWSVKDPGTTGAAIAGNQLTTTAAGTVVVTATIANGTLTGASYVQDFAITVLELSAPVSGMVKDDSGAGLGGAVIVLKQGDKVVYEITADAQGNYTLPSVENGVYNVEISAVVEGKPITITDSIAVEGEAVESSIQSLDGSKTTKVESTPGTPPVAAGGINDQLTPSNIATTLTGEEQVSVSGGGSVELKFVADKMDDSEVAADKSKIEEIAVGQKVDMLLDLSVLKTVKDYQNTVISNGEKVPTLATNVRAQIPVPDHLKGKTGLSIFRMHGGVAEALQKDVADANGEYYTISADGSFMTLYVKNFSTYAIAYTLYNVTNEDGTVSGYGAGETVTINAGSKSGYRFESWTVTSGTVILADPTSAITTFSMPGENVTVKANWTAVSGGDTTPTYLNTVNQPENGTVSATPKAPTQGQTVTVTTTPNAGYVVSQVLVTDAGGNTVAVTAAGANTYTFVQPAGKVTVTVTYKKAETTNTFVDVTAGDWFYDAVMAATSKGWFAGTSATTFSPDSSTTRGMIATIVHRMEGAPVASASAFADVAEGTYYANGVAWGDANHILLGYGNGNYGPNDNITREQLAAILYRYATMKGYDTSKTATLDTFADSTTISNYAKNAMSWAVGNGLITGRGNNILAPTALASRAEVAVVLTRFEALFAN